MTNNFTDEEKWQLITQTAAQSSWFNDARTEPWEHPLSRAIANALQEATGADVHPVAGGIKIMYSTPQRVDPETGLINEESFIIFKDISVVKRRHRMDLTLGLIEAGMLAPRNEGAIEVATEVHSTTNYNSVLIFKN